MRSAVVIGGGPAGSLAALLLARGGMAVTLFEQGRFPREKVCGECLSALGVGVLRRCGLEHAILDGGRMLRRARLFGATTAVTLPLPEPMVGLSRATLDERLLRAAGRDGVVVRQPVRAEAVVATAHGVCVRVRNLSDNRVTEHTADYAIAADGRATFAEPRPRATGDLGIKAHFDAAAADPCAITLYGGAGCYGGVAPIEDGRWNVAFSVPRVMVAEARGDVDAVWRTILARSPAAAAQLGSATRAGAWLAAPLPRFGPPTAITGCLVPVGAAACAIEPVGGEGMGTALRSAELAAAAVLAGDLGPLTAEYRTLWRRRGWFCRLGGTLLADPQWCDAAALAASPLAARLAMWAVGK